MNNLPKHWNPTIDNPLGHALDTEVLPSEDEVTKFNNKQKLLKQRRID